jgi:aquaporin-4
MSINIRAGLAEMIAAFALVLFGPMAATSALVIMGADWGTSVIIIALTHGLVVALMIYAIGNVSGAHINPAVTIPMMIHKKIDLGNGISYIIFQILGAIIGAATHAIVLPMGSEIKYALNTPGQFNGVTFNDSTVFGMEMLLTFLLVFVIFGTAVNKKSPSGWAGFAIGMTVALGHFIGLSVSGASMNPVRTFGPAVISSLQGLDGAFQSHYIYWIAPILGGILASLVYHYIMMSKKDRE